jgi:hypothetical protein
MQISVLQSREEQPESTRNCQVLVATPGILVTWEAVIGKMAARGWPGQIVLGPQLQNNQSKVDWGCASCSRAPALQTLSPLFKPQCKTLIVCHS